MTHSINKLNEEDIRQWEWISKNYIDCPLLLGNGFSLNFSTRLLYRNLYENFVKNCPSDSKKLFDEFGSKNFEIILKHLESTERVSNALNIEHSRISKNKETIKQGLIESINRIHPTPDDIDKLKIKKIANQIKEFSQIFTTNYDLFLYYIIIESKKFGDYFYYLFFDDERFQLFNSGDSKKNNHIYFLHGALFLFEKSINTIKIKKNEENWLIDVITNEINGNNYPLFISEGTSEMKLKAIQSNKYLSYCFRNLKENKHNELVIFGHSLSSQDSHIVKILDEKYEKIAFGIRISEDRTINDIKSEINKIRPLFKKAEIDFYDSSTLFNFD